MGLSMDGVFDQCLRPLFHSEEVAGSQRRGEKLFFVRRGDGEAPRTSQ